MKSARMSIVRGGLAFFAIVSAFLGGYILISPKGFYSWSWVNMGMAYNPHLLLDYGAMTLAAAVPLAAAAAAPSPVLLRSVSGSYALWATAHFLIHLQYRSHFASHASTGEANLLVGVLGFGAVGSIALFVLSLPRDPRQASGVRCARWHRPASPD